VLHVLAVVIPLGLAAAISPVMLTEQTVLLAGPDGRRAAARYAVGATVTLLLFASAVVAFGQTISLPESPHLDATLDLLLGALLLGLALLVRRRQPRVHRARPSRGETRVRAALPFGVVSMATNVTTLGLVAPAAKEVASSDLGFATRALIVVALVALGSLPAWSPVALTEVAPGPAQRGLRALSGVIARRGRAVVVGCVGVFGALLLLRGASRLHGL
jgi:hypothetical protein